MMISASLFYTSSLKTALPLYLLSKLEWQEMSTKLTATQKHYFNNYQFNGELGDICFIYEKDDLLNKVYLGYGENSINEALSIAATKLPPNNYMLQKTLSQKAYLNWSAAQYCFLDYKKQKILPRVLCLNKDDLAKTLPLAEMIFLVRNLINQPANHLNPERLAHIIAEMATSHQADFKQWVGEDLLINNFPAIHAVGRASDSAPRLLSLTWGNENHPRVTLVGKGVCFDSGGLDIKPSINMRLMKKDMGGAAHVIALAQWIMVTHLPIRLEVLIPAVENAVGPQAFRPSDILTMRNGLTVEVENTDAEGRLILADALVKAAEAEPDLLIDFATLTGAARVALGTDIAAIFSNDDSLAQKLTDSSLAVDDPIWRLPLFSGYGSMLKSNFADLQSANPSSYAGAITAALFLEHFIPNTLPWLHFDIMAWNITSKPGKPEGGEAMGLLAVADYLLKTWPKNLSLHPDIKI